MELIGQFNEMAKRDDSLSIGIQASDPQNEKTQKANAYDFGKVGLLAITKVYNQNQMMLLAGIKSDFVSTAIKIWYES